MDFKTFLLIIIGSALANNVVLEQFFGVTPALGAKGSAKALAKYGLAVAAVTLVAALCTACISIGVYSTFVAALWVLIAASVIGHFFTDKYLLIALNGRRFRHLRKRRRAAALPKPRLPRWAQGLASPLPCCSLPGSRQRSMTSMSPRPFAASPCGSSPPASFRWPLSRSSKPHL